MAAVGLSRLRAAQPCMRAALSRRAASVLILLIGSAGCAEQTSDFTGIWKSNCRDYWGLQIKPVENGLYSVAFCGLSGCLDAGQWTPNTRIAGDPLYEVISAKSIRIQRKDSGHFTYTRCSADPYWIPVPQQ